MKYFVIYFVIFSVICGLKASSLQDNELNDNCTPENKDFFTGVSNFFTGFAKYLKIANINKDVKFYLYTKQNPSARQELILGNRNSVINSYFDPRNPTRIIIHGFNSAAGSCVNVELRNAYLRKGNYNIIVVDWSVMSTGALITYVRAVKWVEPVGNQIGKFTNFLNAQFNVSFDDMYVIGHSLGAHVAGYAGRSIKPNLYNTIFALDPAYPLSDTLENGGPVQSGDAFYVESIHTNIQMLGYYGLLGDASMYPAYGRSKKGHSGAFNYLAQSINEPEKFLAMPCDSFKNIQNKNCVCELRSDCFLSFQMGGEPSQKKKGIYYVDVD